MASIGGWKLLSPTPGATVTLAIDTSVPKHLATWMAGEIETVNISGTPLDGQELVLIITNDGTLGRVITLGTGFASLGIVTGVISKKSTLLFVASGGSFIEMSRTVGL